MLGRELDEIILKKKKNYLGLICLACVSPWYNFDTKHTKLNKLKLGRLASSVHSDLDVKFFHVIINCSGTKTSWLLSKVASSIGLVYILFTYRNINKQRYTWIYQENWARGELSETVLTEEMQGPIPAPPKNYKTCKIKCYHNNSSIFVLKDENLSKTLRISQRLIE